MERSRGQRTATAGCTRCVGALCVGAGRQGAQRCWTRGRSGAYGLLLRLALLRDLPRPAPLPGVRAVAARALPVLPGAAQRRAPRVCGRCEGCQQAQWTVCERCLLLCKLCGAGVVLAHERSCMPCARLMRHIDVCAGPAPSLAMIPGVRAATDLRWRMCSIVWSAVQGWTR